MSVRDIAKRQMINRVYETAENPVGRLMVPRGGWIAFVRKALGMSGAQLGRRLSLSRSRISQAEKAELTGGVTLRAMEDMAEAMGCKLVYAIVPATGILEDVIEAQARKIASQIVKRASTHMALEKQALTNEKTSAEVDRLVNELMRAPPSNFWDN